MVTSSVLKNAIEELYSITKVNLCLYDALGNTLACTTEEIALSKDAIMVFATSPADSQVISSSHLFKVYDEEELAYILLATGSGEDVYTVGRIGVSQLRMLLAAYKEKFDRNNFFQNLIMDNMLLVDMYNRAKKLHIEVAVPRVVYVIESDSESNATVSQLLKNMFSPESGDYVTEVDEQNVILVKALEEGYTSIDLNMVAQSIVDTINAEAMVNVRVAFGSTASELKDVSRSYKEAMVAVDVGKIFYEERMVNSYSALGIGRLIYQLPANLCQMFIEEIFKNADPATFDEEIVSTVYKFFENSLNVSETSRQLFIHRNTLVYRVEKLKALTGLDVRVFDDALTFMIAMMVYNYLRYLEKEN